jgi:hypothetical protein
MASPGMYQTYQAHRHPGSSNNVVSLAKMFRIDSIINKEKEFCIYLKVGLNQNQTQ